MQRRNYKSWKGLKKQLEERLCAKMQDRIEYTYASFRNIHESREVKILFDKKDLLVFTSGKNDSYMGDDIDQKIFKFNDRPLGYDEDADFLCAATNFLNMDIEVALSGDYHSQNLKAFPSNSDCINGYKTNNFYDYIEKQNISDIVKVFAILDKRVGKRTLLKLIETKVYESYPKWLLPIFELRCEVEGIDFERKN